MKLNKEKLDQMVEAVMIAYIQTRKEEDIPEIMHEIANGRLNAIKELFRTALTPFCMEMTDEEIMNKAEKRSSNSLVQSGFMMGAKLIRDGK